MSLADNLKKFLNIFIDYIGIVFLIVGGLVIVGTLLPFSVATIDLVFTRAELAFNPLFGEMIVKAYEDLPGLFSLLYTSLFSGAIPSSLTVLSMIVLVLGVIIAVFGLLEMLKEKVDFLGFLKDKSIGISIFYLALGGATIVFSLILYFIFRGQLIEGIQNLYLIMEIFVFGNVPILGFILLSVETLPNFGFYLISIPALVVVLISIVILIASKPEATPAPRTRTTTSSSTNTQ
jgi:hypothetical protein